MRKVSGIVASAKMQGTVTVKVARTVTHSRYHKQFTLHSKFMADTNGLEVKEGDKVEIEELGKKLSKNKCWKVTNVLS